MPTNLLKLNSKTIVSGTPEIWLERDGDLNVNLVISFNTTSRPKTAADPGTDAVDTEVNAGSLKPSAPVVISATNDGRKTTFLVAVRIESKKPSTGSGDRIKRLVETVSDKEALGNLTATEFFKSL